MIQIANIREATSAISVAKNLPMSSEEIWVPSAQLPACSCSNTGLRSAFFVIVNIGLLVLIILHVTACPVDCWTQHTDDDSPAIRFFSAHIMQCKYEHSEWLRVLPGLLLASFVLILVQWNWTWRVFNAVLNLQASYAVHYKLDNAASYQANKYMLATLIMDILLCVGSLGAYMIVQYDHRWLTNIPDDCAFQTGPAAYDVRPYHGTGVVLLLVSVACIHFFTALLYKFEIRPSITIDTTNFDNKVTPFQRRVTAAPSEKRALLAASYRRTAYIDGEIVYVGLAVAFIISYLVNSFSTAIFLEYMVLGFGILLSIYNLYLSSRAEYLYLQLESTQQAMPRQIYFANNHIAL